MKTIKIFTIAILLFHFQLLKAEFLCGVIEDSLSTPTLRAMGTSEIDWNNYIDYDYSKTSIKTIKLSFHIFQKNDGSNNFPNNSTSLQKFQSIVNQLNDDMANNVVMNLNPVPTAYHKNTRIRYSLEDIYFWQNDFDNIYGPPNDYGPFYWNSNSYNNKGRYLHAKYVKDNPAVTKKDSCVHVFFCVDGTLGNGGYTYQLGNDPWFILNKQHLLSTKEISNNIRHETGHLMGIQHTWNMDDNCEDSPLNPGCWDVNDCIGENPSTPSNNVMDYNNCQCAYTQCQINRMHYFLLSNTGSIYKCLTSNTVFDNPTISISSVNLFFNQAVTATIENLPFGVTVEWNDYVNNLVNIDAVGNSAVLTPTGNQEGVFILSCTLNYGRLGTKVLQKSLNIIDCQDDVILNGNLSSGNYCGNCIRTKSGTTINSNKNITIKYKNRVIIENGFKIEAGASLSINPVNSCQ